MEIFGYDVIVFMMAIILIAIEYLALGIGMYFFLYYKPKRLNTVKNMKTKREPNETKKEFRIRATCDRVPERSNTLTAVILCETGLSKILYFPLDKNDFVFNKSLYFIVNPHTCENGAKLCVYVEGVPLPLNYDVVEKETVEVEYTDFVTGAKKKSVISKIKNLKWDGKILYMFSNRKFAENFTKIEPELLPLLIFIVGTITLVISCVGIGVTWFAK